MLTDKQIEEGITAYLKRVKGAAGPMDLYREAARLGWEAAARPEAVATNWQPIETAPIGKTVLLWWRPKDPNPLAEACVIGQVSGWADAKWWNGQRGEYQDLWHVTHWQELPSLPQEGKPR